MRVEPRLLVRRLNPTCTKTLEEVVERAASSRSYEILPEHYLLGLLEVEDGDVARILQHFRKDKARVAARIERALQAVRTGNTARPVFAENLFGWMEDAWVVASLERSAVQLRSGDLLLEFLTRPAKYTAETFEDLEAIPLDELRRDYQTIVLQSSEELEVPEVEEGVARPRGPSAAGREALDKYTISFTERARQGEIDPIFGRDREIRQIIDVLSRRRKNNPIVVGEAGVGKTALVEGLALEIAAGNVPDSMKAVELLGLDMGLLKAGAGVRGELEARLKRVIAEVKASPTPIVLFIDEAHQLVGGGADNDVPNLLKPALARGELRTVAATTWGEYKKYFEKDAALERRFQPVKLEEPSVKDAVLMLRGLRETYENAHGVTIRDDAVEAAADLSDRYIIGRQMPDKAVDLIDTAAARVKIEQDTPPESLVSLRSELASLTRKRDALQRDVDAGAVVDEDGDIEKMTARLGEIGTELAEVETRWTAEKEAVDELKSALQILKDAEDDGRDPALTEVKKQRAELADKQGDNPLCHAEVDRDAIAQVVADWTGIPVGKMKSSTMDAVLHLESNLGKRIKGQDQATTAVSEAIRMAYAGVRDPKTPIAVLLFVGPSGVGKTETALALADLLYGGERCMTTINMSEFQEKHTVSRLIGSPPGYVGFGEGGVLTEAARQRPYQVVLLDECEKADLEVMNLFYQVFDKGMLSDGEGREVGFRNTVIILTSNLASDKIMKMHESGAKPDMEAVGAKVYPALSKHFKPALLARMTVVPFRPMDPDILADIARLKLGSLGNRLQEAHGMETTFEDSLIQELVSRCTEGETGARALDHAMRRSLMPVLARGILERLADGTTPKTLSIGLGEDGKWALNFG